jgi:hypothetical protein
MNELVLGVWHDLREKRLWPVAAGLLLALLLVPFLLVKPAKQAPAQAGPSVAMDAKQLEPIDAAKALLKPAEESVSNGSALEAFLSKDPFKPIKDLRTEAGVGPATIASSGSGAATSGGATGGSNAGGTPIGGGSTGGSPGGSTGGGKTTTTVFTYTANLRFGPSGHEETFKDVQQLTVIPNEQTPLLVFLGVTTDRKKAVFLVDAKLDTSGEGRCKPSNNECTFLYLAQDEDSNEQLFTDVDGTEYTLRLDKLRRVELGADGSDGGSKGSSRKPKAGGSRTLDSPFGSAVTGFGFPLFSDEVQTTVQNTAPLDSSPAQIGR